MQERDIYAAFKTWHSFYYEPPVKYHPERKHTFAAFLGGFEGDLINLGSWKLTPEGERKVALLCGPHARTMVKVYFAQHPELPTPPLLMEVTACPA